MSLSEADSAETMAESCLMISPAGRFFDNVSGYRRYGQPILKGGVGQALAGIQLDQRKFLRRGGLYSWSRLHE
jgi:radical S-adenosyl methionine domain-containing protein 2